MMKRLLSGLGYGGLAGALLTAPLIGLMFLADKLLDLPFAPFAPLRLDCPGHARTLGHLRHRPDD